ncbi:MAG TPA: alpha/beta hydrolase [Abditibacteriaceae bacterium]
MTFRVLLAGVLLTTPLVSQVVSAAPMSSNWKAKLDPQMKAVLDEWMKTKPKPIEKLTPAQARVQPLPGVGVMRVLQKQGKSTAPEAVGSVMMQSIPGPIGPIPVRVYKPKGEGPFPVLVYIHGGGWVIASIQAYDSSARALCNAANAMVVSVGYHYAPEHKFPSAHEESYAATQWLMKNVQGWGGDPKRVAIAGESAGGNMATAVCMMARDRKGMMPIHQLLVYPVAQIGKITPSYRANWDAKPLNVPTLKWFGKHELKSPAQGKHPYMSVLNGNVKGLPPATIVLAEIDPLLSEGQMYAAKLRKAGIPTKEMLYTGVTHEFFGMGAVVNKAKQAIVFAGGELKKAYAK